VSASTQNQALSALVFLYAQVLNQDIGWLDELIRAKRPARVPVVLTREEVRAVLGQLDGTGHLMASLLYGAGLRLLEYCRLRVKDVDLERGEIVVSCRSHAQVFEFSVHDDGVGIEERHFERIFGMFQSLHPERETTGVGLTIVKRIVEMHGGSIRVDSTPGVGTTFRFSVPKPPRDRQLQGSSQSDQYRSTT